MQWHGRSRALDLHDGRNADEVTNRPITARWPADLRGPGRATLASYWPSRTGCYAVSAAN